MSLMSSNKNNLSLAQKTDPILDTQQCENCHKYQKENQVLKNDSQVLNLVILKLIQIHQDYQDNELRMKMALQQINRLKNQLIQLEEKTKVNQITIIQQERQLQNFSKSEQKNLQIIKSLQIESRQYLVKIQQSYSLALKLNVSQDKVLQLMENEKQLNSELEKLRQKQQQEFNEQSHQRFLEGIRDKSFQSLEYLYTKLNPTSKQQQQAQTKNTLHHHKRQQIDKLNNQFSQLFIKRLQSQSKQLSEIGSRSQTNPKFSTSLYGELLKQSAIIKSLSLVNRLLGLFQPNKINHMKLLYQANQTKFDLGQYFKYYGQQTNTLLICTTTNSKTIGAFTPLAHQFSLKNGKQSKQNYVQDETNSSFIFSLTENEKFKLRNPSKAISRDPKRQTIQFGADFEFCIRNFSDKNPCESRMNWNFHENNMSSYYNSKYISTKDFSSQQYLDFMKKFNGAKSMTFCTKQLEIWKIQFLNQQ